MSEEEAKKILRQAAKSLTEIGENMYKIWCSDDIIPNDHTQSASIRADALRIIGNVNDTSPTLVRMFKSMDML